MGATTSKAKYEVSDEQGQVLGPHNAIVTRSITRMQRAAKATGVLAMGMQRAAKSGAMRTAAVTQEPAAAEVISEEAAIQKRLQKIVRDVQAMRGNLHIVFCLDESYSMVDPKFAVPGDAGKENRW